MKKITIKVFWCFQEYKVKTKATNGLMLDFGVSLTLHYFVYIDWDLNSCCKKNKTHQFFRKAKISYSLIRTLTFGYQEVRNNFFGKIVVLCLLAITVLNFALFPYKRRFSDPIVLPNRNKLFLIFSSIFWFLLRIMLWIKKLFCTFQIVNFGKVNCEFANLENTNKSVNKRFSKLEIKTKTSSHFIGKILPFE